MWSSSAFPGMMLLWHQQEHPGPFSPPHPHGCVLWCLMSHSDWTSYKGRKFFPFKKALKQKGERICKVTTHQFSFLQRKWADLVLVLKQFLLSYELWLPGLIPGLNIQCTGTRNCTLWLVAIKLWSGAAQMTKADDNWGSTCHIQKYLPRACNWAAPEMLLGAVLAFSQDKLV